MRPTTGPMVFFDDVVGTADRPAAGGRCSTRRTPSARIVPRSATRSGATTCRSARRPSRSCATGSALAVLTRHTNLATMRTPSRLELTYLATADELARMIAVGRLPDRRRADRAAAGRAAGR